MDIEKLISEVFVRSPLWDQKDQNHHNRFVLDKLWDEVALELNATRVIVRNKWKSLRDKFRTVLASVPKSGDPAMCSYKGQWKYFQSLLFLRDQFTSRISGGSFSVMDEDEVLNDTSQNMQENKEYVENENQTPMPVASKIISSEQCTESVTPSSPSRPSSSTESHQYINMKRKRHTSEDIVSESLKVGNKKMQYLEEKRLEKSNEDDDLNFFKSLLPHVKILSSYDKMSYRINILKVTQDFLTSTSRTESVNPTNGYY